MIESIKQNKNEMFITDIVKRIEIQAGDIQKFKPCWQKESEEDYFVWGIGSSHYHLEATLLIH